MHDPQLQIKKHLFGGGRITVITGQQMFHTTETRRIISRLRKEGMNIVDRTVKNDDGVRFKEYWLVR